MTASNDRYEQLRERYIASFGQKRADIQSAWVAVLASPDVEASRMHLQHLVHRLGGSAGAYGFSNIGTLARRLDLQLIALAENAMIGAELQAMVDDLCGALVEYSSNVTNLST